MKIGMVVHDLAVSGGYQKLVLRLSEQLASKGHSVIIYTVKLDRKECYPDIINNFDIVSLDASQLGTAGQAVKIFYGNHADVIREYKVLSKKIDPDLDALILHDEVSLFSLLFYRPNNKDQKIIWMLNNQLTPRLGAGPNLKIHIRKNIAKGLVGAGRDLTTLPISSAYKSALSRVDHFAVYDTNNKNLVRKYIGREADLVYAGADLDRYSKIKLLDHKGFNILSVGVAFPHRRYEDLIEATKELVGKEVPVKVTIVGRRDLDKSYGNKLLKQVSDLKLEKHIEFIDYLSDLALLEQYRSTDAFVFINDAETWGIAVFESLAAKIPTVITSNIGAADIIKDKEDAWVVPPRSPIKVAEALYEIYSHPKPAKAMTSRASAKIKELVSWEAYASRMLNLLKTTGAAR